MGFGLEMAGMPKAERTAKIRQAAATLHLTDYLARKPRQLSGGQRQRVAIGRAIVRDPKVFLFDEPLSNLDAELRVKMRLEIAKLHRELRATMIYVTHDQVEAMTLADKIVVLRAGLVEQVGSPLTLYSDPDNSFVAGFIGSPRMNFIDAVVKRSDGENLVLALPDLGLDELPVRPRSMPAQVPRSVTLGLRPEHFIHDADAAYQVKLPCGAVERLGSVSYLYTAPGEDATLTAALDGSSAVSVGDVVSMSIDPARCFLFDADGARI